MHRAVPVLLLTLISFGTSLAQDAGEDPGAPAPGTDDRYTALADSLGALLEGGSERGLDEAILAEADALALVAEELHQEGDSDLATGLLEDALALFAPGETQ